MPELSRERWHVVSPYLDRALELGGEDQASWLASLRSEDPALAAEVEALLEERSVLCREGFLEGGAVALPPGESLTGQAVGAYALESQIGQGGMGGVWLARRSDGRFEGRVAVKLLNPSLVGRAGEERFRREGRILARLTHPHIAYLIDVGVSPAGQPFIVLEHVEGEHIDRYCDARSLGIEARIRLFLDVAAAVAHAHAHLIVHRDIKPSNVLVRTDGEVKLLDFGIAKLLESESPTGEATALTREGGPVLTPEYAAPEQVTGGQITTATDVYALGVLLYAMLSGRHPAGESARSPAELLKAIVETEPLRMSSALVSTRTRERDALPPAATRRGTTPERLRRLLRGDLDTVVARALKKIPQERYASVTAFADDLRRHLDHQPLEAQPDTLAYRTAKFVRRHRLPVALGLLLLMALVAGLAGTSWQAREAAKQRDRALAQLLRAEGMDEFTAFLLGEIAPADKPVMMREVLGRAEQMVEKRFASDEALAVELMASLGSIYYAAGEVANANRTLNRAYDASLGVSDPAVRARASCEWGRALAESGKFSEARAMVDAGLALLSDEARFVNLAAGCLINRGFIATREGDPATALKAAQMAVERLHRVPTAYSASRANALQLLARAHQALGDIGAAERSFALAMDQLQRIGRDQTKGAATLLNNWALARAATDTLGALDLQRRSLDDGGRPVSLSNYGRLLNRLARYGEALPVYQSARDTARQHRSNWVVGAASLGLARAYRNLGDLERAQAALSEGGPALKAYFSAGHHSLADLSHEEGLLAAARGDAESARRLLSEAVALQKQAPEKHVSHIETRLELARLELRSARAAAAEEHARAALEMAQRFQGDAPRSAWVGLSQLALGEIREAEGDSLAARQLFGDAVFHMAPTLGESHPATEEARSRLAYRP
jgi:serine/threonine-protein kinase